MFSLILGDFAVNDLEQFGLNERQRVFVLAVLEGSTLVDAADKAGYVGNTAPIRSPAVLAAIHAGVQHTLQSEAAASLHVLKRIRDDESAPARVRADIGVKMLQLAGHVMPRTATSGADKPLAEMSRDEMVAYIDRNQAAIDRAESELAARAKDVSVPSSVPKSTDATPNAMTFLD